ncbi:MAG: cytochrome P450 [Candidatus Binatia bacterium]|nr:cytochrome P450 [Candidatus Binatia bacterium]
MDDRLPTLAELELTVLDPYPDWKARREAGPVEIKQVMGLPNAKAFTRDACEAVLKDEAAFSARVNQESMGPYMGTVLLGMDGPEHTVYRNLVSHAFRRSALERWESELIEPTIGELLDAIVPDGRADLVRAVTSRYPLKVITSLMGVPVEDVDRFQSWAEDVSSGPLNPERGLASSKAMRDYLTPIVEERKRNPKDDLVTDIVTAEVAGERLSDEHIYGFLRLLLPAGAETTYRVFGNTLFALLSDQSALERVRTDRSLVPRAIEETLRWQTSVTLVSRVAKQDTKVAGCPIAAGTVVSMMVGASNRDEQHFEEPDEWNLDRPEQPGHLSFGWGRHLCLGMHLARLELLVGVNAVLDRLPNLRFDPGAPPAEIRGHAFRGPVTLPVLFDPS